MDRLFISNDCSCAMSVGGGEIYHVRIRDDVRARRNARTVVTGLHLLAEVSIEQSPGILSRALVYRRVQERSSDNGQPGVVVLEKLPFHVRFDVAAGRAVATVRLGL